MNLQEIPDYTTGSYATPDYCRGERQALIDDRKEIALLLYNLCSRLQSESQMTRLGVAQNPGLLDWWEARKHEDSQEEARKVALAKLTSEERELLGVRE